MGQHLLQPRQIFFGRRALLLKNLLEDLGARVVFRDHSSDQTIIRGEMEQSLCKKQ